MTLNHQATPAGQTNPDTLELPQMYGRYFSSHPDADVRCSPGPSPARVSTGTNLSIHIKQLPGVGAKKTCFPETPTSLKASTPSPSPHLRPHLRQRQPGLNAASASTPRRPQIFLPPHFCPRAFSLCEGLSTAFLSNSQRGGGSTVSQSSMELWQAEDVKRATVGLRSCQPGAACARQSLHPSSGHSERSLRGGLSQKAQLVPWA